MNDCEMSYKVAITMWEKVSQQPDDVTPPYKVLRALQQQDRSTNTKYIPPAYTARYRL